jgi:hypothetical protein
MGWLKALFFRGQTYANSHENLAKSESKKLIYVLKSSISIGRKRVQVDC